MKTDRRLNKAQKGVMRAYIALRDSQIVSREKIHTEIKQSKFINK